MGAAKKPAIAEPAGARREFVDGPDVGIIEVEPL
jgi:hypothetical protein